LISRDAGYKLKRLTRKERRILAAHSRKWRKKLEKYYRAIEESTRITAEDLRIIVR
jgi:nucleoside-triphosphatase THEP1